MLPKQVSHKVGFCTVCDATFPAEVVQLVLLHVVLQFFLAFQLLETKLTPVMFLPQMDHVVEEAGELDIFANATLVSEHDRVGGTVIVLGIQHGEFVTPQAVCSRVGEIDKWRMLSAGRVRQRFGVDFILNNWIRCAEAEMRVECPGKEESTLTHGALHGHSAMNLSPVGK